MKLFLESTAAILLLVLLLTQVIWPMFSSRKFFWLFKENDLSDHSNEKFKP